MSKGLTAATLVGLLVFSLLYYVTSLEVLSLRLVAICSALLVLLLAQGAVRSLVLARRSPNRDEQVVAGVGVSILCPVMLAGLSTLFLVGVVPLRHLPWLAPLAFLLLPVLLLLATGLALEGFFCWRFFLVALGAGALTWGQLAWVEHEHTWVFVRIGIFPVPLLGITVAASGLAAFCGVLVLLCGVTFHLVRAAVGAR